MLSLVNELEKITEMTKICKLLQNHLRASIETWARFSSHNGDVTYFSDIPPQDIQLPLQKIKGSFEKLKDLDKRLVNTIRTVKASAHTVRNDYSYA